jgi:hypothetical protein
MLLTGIPIVFSSPFMPFLSRFNSVAETRPQLFQHSAAAQRKNARGPKFKTFR